MMAATVTPGADFSPMVTCPEMEAVGLGLLSGVCAFVINDDWATKLSARNTEATRRRLTDCIGNLPPLRPDMKISTISAAGSSPVYD